MEEILMKIKLFKQENKFDDIVTLLTEDLLETYKNAELFAEKGEAYYNINQYDLCEFFVEKALQIDSNNSKANNCKGALLYRSKKHDSAFEFYHKSIENNPEFAQPYNGLGNIHFIRKEYEISLKYYHKAIEKDANFVRSYSNLGNIYFAFNQYNKALDYYQRAIEIDPEYDHAYNGLGNVYYKLNDYAKAIHYYQKSIDLNPRGAQAYNGIGSVYYSLNNYSEASEYFLKAISLEPNFSHAYNNLGNLYSTILAYDDAVVCYQKAIEADPNNAHPYNNLGNAYLNLSKYKEAIESYQRAIDIDSGYTIPYYHRGLVYEELKDYQNALIDFESYVKFTKNDPDYYTSVAIAKVAELKKLIKNIDYSRISELIVKIKELLLFKGQCITHYTGISVAKLLILDGSKLRLSEGAFLNDTSEGRELFNYLPTLDVTSSSNRNDTVALPFTPKPFIGSFVAETKHDDLTLWRMYGKENKEEARGCAITLDKNLLLKELKNTLLGDKKSDDLKTDDEEFNFYKVVYRQLGASEPFSILGAEPQEIAILNQYMRELADKVSKYKKKKNADINSLFKLLNTIAYLFKSAEYQYEHELRLIVTGVGIKKEVDVSFIPPKVYINLVSIQPLVRKITLGPKVDRAEEWASAFYYKLDSVGCHPEIVISHLPFK